MKAIRIKSLSKSYGELKAVDNISLEINKGEIFGLLGPNGAGKTTLLNMLEGLSLQDSGLLEILGMTFKKDRTEIQRRTGVQLQSAAFIPELKVGEQLKAFAALYGVKLSIDNIKERLKDFGLQEKIGAFPAKLSGGQKQALSLAAALIHQPEIIFLDEPTAGLDAQGRLLLWAKIRELNKNGVTVLLTTHNIEEAEMLCSRVGILNNGTLLAVGSPAALINSRERRALITVSSGLEGYKILDNYPAAKSADFNGERLFILTDDAIATLKDLFRAAGDSNIYFGDLHIKQPSLEDVFLELTGHTMENTGNITEEARNE